MHRTHGRAPAAPARQGFLGTRAGMAALVCLLVAVLPIAQADPGPTPASAPLRFEDYPAALSHIGTFAPTRPPRPGVTWKMDMYLRADHQDGALDFADRFTVYQAGCGSGCLAYVLIDRVSGKVHPGQTLNNGRLAHRRDSRLLIVTHNEGYGYPDQIEYYAWTGKRLALIKREQRAFIAD